MYILTVGSLAVLQVRYIGVSNETSYGVSEFMHAAKSAGLPRIQTIQNCECVLHHPQASCELLLKCHITTRSCACVVPT